MILFDKFVVRLRESIQTLALIASVIMTHMNLIHLSKGWKDFITLICFILLAFQRPVAYKTD